MINASYTELDLNVPFVYKSAAKVLTLAAMTTAAVLIFKKVLNSEDSRF